VDNLWARSPPGARESAGVTFQTAVLLLVTAAMVGGMIFRPWGTREWMWAVAAAIAVLVDRAVGPADAWSAVASGANVYAFLVGIIALAELARAARLFDWLALYLLRIAGASRVRLFVLVYALGVVVTAVLSNDTTVIVLTPAVLAMLARTDVDPRPFLFCCAFVANAASLVLPIANPANLLVFGGMLPPLHVWVRWFLLPAIAALAVTLVTLLLLMNREMRPRLRYHDVAIVLAPHERRAGIALLVAVALLLLGSLRGDGVGYVAAGAAVLALSTAALSAPRLGIAVLRRISWQVVPLVAGLFVVVAALDRAGTLAVLRDLLVHAGSSQGTISSRLELATELALACNLFNNLPIAVAVGNAFHASNLSPYLARIAMIAIDLGPNLSVTGSLATMLWLITLRRAGYDVSEWSFFRAGIVVLLPALAAATLAAGL